MAKYANGSVAKLDDCVIDAVNNGRNFSGKVIAVNDNGDTGFVTVAWVGLAQTVGNMIKMIPPGHINKRTQTVILDDMTLALFIEIGPTSSFRKIFDPAPVVVDESKINSVAPDNSFTAVAKDVSPLKRRKLVSV